MGAVLIAVGANLLVDNGTLIAQALEMCIRDSVRSLEGVAPTKKHAVFTIAVPTTAGTAAEVTINYVITDVEKKRKFCLLYTSLTLGEAAARRR